MAQNAGYLGKFQSDGASEDAGIDTWSMDATADMHETSVFTTQPKAFIAGLTGFTVTASGGSDSTRLVIATVYASAKWYSDATHFWAGSLTLNSLGDAAGVQDKSTVNYGFQGSSTLTVPSY